MVRDQNTPKDDFIFFADRLCRIVVETGLNELPFEDCKVITPTNEEYSGLKRSTKVY